MASLYPTVTFFVCMFTLSFFSDYLIKIEKRKEFGKYIKQKIKGSTASEFKEDDKLNKIEQIKPFSKTSIKISVTLSLASLFTIILIQWVLLGYDFHFMKEGVDDERIANFILLLSLIISGNIIVDYISFCQTLVIINSIGKSKNRSSLIILLFTDILASINIFTLFYALFLAIGVYYITDFEIKTPIAIKIEEINSDDIPKKLIGIYDYMNTYDMNNFARVSIYKKDQKINKTLSTIYLMSDNKITNENVISSIRLSIRDKIKEIEMEEKEGKIQIDSLFKKENVTYQISGTMTHRANQPGFFHIWYNFSYLLTDEVQDQFIIVTTLSPGFQPIDSLRRSVHTELLTTEKRLSAPVFCSKEEENYPYGCSQQIAILSEDITTLPFEVSKEVRLGGNLPLYTFLLTSLSPTLLIYFFYTSIYIFKLLYIISKYISLPVVNFGNLEEHPIAILSFPIIFIASVIYFISAAT